MSQGITAYDFVQQVYYMQEKVILDYWPTDDKYKEVLMEANLVLQELQNCEDWSWLREQLLLGDTTSTPHEIPEYKLPDWVYKVSTLNHDSMKLYRIKPPHFCRCHHHCFHHGHELHFDLWDYIEVPFASVGDNQFRKQKQYTELLAMGLNDPKLRAVNIGDIITFNRILTPFECHRVAAVDVQRRIEQFHICDDTCVGVDLDEDLDYTRDDDGNFVNPCNKIKPLYLKEIPDPNYVIMQTAARHAEGSPPAQGRITGLQDNAQRILSAMRQNDASATDSDYVEWDSVGCYEVL